MKQREIGVVLQKHTRGCGVAALSMLTGMDYDAVAARFPFDLQTQGLYYNGVESFLADAGYAIRKLHRWFGWVDSPERTPWPCEPFADVHLCEVIVYEGAPMNHFIVMLKDGSCLDPLASEPRRLSDYFKVNSVAGVYKVA